MSKLIDLTNQQFGKLTVYALDNEKNKQMKEERKRKLRSSSPTFWLCKCECGETTSVQSAHLRSGHTTSCGCNYKKYDFQSEDMIGQKFNKWAVMAYGYYDPINRQHLFHCLCDCGNTGLVNGYNLIGESSKDCGCGRNATLKSMVEKDLCGQRFGKLTVLQKTGYTKAGKATYKCQCDCGEITPVVGNSLTTGHTTSCGCVLSKSNTLIANILNELQVEHIQEKTFVDNGFTGRFDFYLPLYNAVIEYDGEQHFYPVDFAGRGEEWAKHQFEITQKRDNIKNNYCHTNHINLLRIPYYEKPHMKDIITNFINSL